MYGNSGLQNKDDGMSVMKTVILVFVLAVLIRFHVILSLSGSSSLSHNNQADMTNETLQCKNPKINTQMQVTPRRLL